MESRGPMANMLAVEDDSEVTGCSSLRISMLTHPARFKVHKHLLVLLQGKNHTSSRTLNEEVRSDCEKGRVINKVLRRKTSLDCLPIKLKPLNVKSSRSEPNSPEEHYV